MNQQQNEELTRTGPGTLMGDLFRRYWLPVMLTRDLPAPGGVPVRVKVLSERLLAVRDTDGKVGLIGEFCAHRGVSLWFGRNEPGGIRCPYHGWKYDVKGQCTEIPSEPEGSTHCQRIKLAAYPLLEINGVAWTYMGPPEHQPPHPQFEFARVPAEQTYMSLAHQECNYLQALDGGIDSSHVSFLHGDAINSDPLFKGSKGNEYNLKDLRPQFDVGPTEGGINIAVRRNAEAGSYYWRITPVVLPTFIVVPPRGTHPIHGHVWVPIDDENCMTWSFSYHPTRALTPQERAALEEGAAIHVKLVPGTYRPAANRDNDYLIDRAAQLAGTKFSGIDGIGVQDIAVQESMGAIQDRTKEHLVSTDRGLVMARRTLLQAAKDLRERGTTPPGVDPEHHKVRGAALVLPHEVPFAEGAREALRALPGVPPASV
ncbi:MAG TPA: aromatic ring-hydroxylating dioxygenase subunit alpha [Ramlibacter sp.]|jgi:nitrite reductase/ring-hydroxylating ferredoxin subunit|nr:aromatic ring-hydroxylating dioxygenase subunit alpha [Ramlibacter sp.]